MILAALDPGHQIATANFVLAMSCIFTLGLPLILINGHRMQTRSIKRTDALPTLSAELAYEFEIFGWTAE